MKPTLLRRKLDSITNETGMQADEFFDHNLDMGIKPDAWPDPEHFVALCEACPELEKICGDGQTWELDTLYEFAGLMEADEFEEIRRTDPELTERLLDGPHLAFEFELDEECIKRAEELRILLEQP